MRDTDEALHHRTPDERDDAFAARIAAPLRAAEVPDPLLGARVLAAIRAGTGAEAPAAVPLARAADRRAGAAADRSAAVHGRPWWRRTVTVGVAPLAGLGLAACLAATVLVGAAARRATRAVPEAARVAAAAPAAARVDTVHLVRFVFVAPDARTVSLVGDFNAWDRTAVQLTRSGAGGTWTATVALPAGRHEYAFLVDGDRWAADPGAAATIEDEFGVESSVVTIDTPIATATRRS